MNKTWNPQILATTMLEVMPKLTRLMAVHMMSLTENEATMMQMGALHMLYKNNLTISDLAKKRNVSLQAASAFVQGLVDKGWVVRVEDPNDRRRSILKVTDEGRIQAETMKKQMTAHLSGLMSDLSDEELNASQIFLTTLAHIVQEHYIDETD